MTARNLSATLKLKKKGWIAINEKNELVISASSFAALCKKVEKTKEKLTLVPAAEKYFGFITYSHA